MRLRSRACWQAISDRHDRCRSTSIHPTMAVEIGPFASHPPNRAKARANHQGRTERLPLGCSRDRVGTAGQGRHPVLDDSTPIRAVLGGAADTLARVFEVRHRSAGLAHQRRRRDNRAGTRSWRRRCRRSTVAVCELELELKHGDPEALFDLARKIDATVPVRLGV